MKKIFLTAILALFLSINANAATFNLSFDDTFDDTLAAPFVGEGTFYFDGTLPDGTYTLSSLSNYTFNFEFNDGFVFNTDSIISDPGIVLVILSDNGSGQQVNFDKIGGFPTTTYGGSLEFESFASPDNILTPDPSYILSFEISFGQPNYIPTLYAILPSENNNNPGHSGFAGNYGPTAVPVPAAVWLFGSGLAGIVLLRRRQEAR